MVDIFAAQVTLAINVPSNKIVATIKAVTNVAAVDFPVSHASSIPETEIAYDQNWLRAVKVVFTDIRV